MICLTLPYPISANRYWRKFLPRGHKREIMVVSDEAKAYRKEVAWRAKAAGVRKPFQHRVKVHLELYPHLPQDFAKRAKLDPDFWDDSVQCIDLTNAEKVLLDALNGIAFLDDKWVWEYSAKRMEPDGEARAVLTIEPLEKQRIQPDLQLEGTQRNETIRHRA